MEKNSVKDIKIENDVHERVCRHCQQHRTSLCEWWERFAWPECVLMRI